MDRRGEILSAFGRRVAELRRQRGMEVAELAFAADLDVDQLERIEAGEINLLFTTICAIAQGLEVDPGTLLETLPG